MKERIENILTSLEALEVRGSKNLNLLLYAIQQANALKEEENANK